MARKSNENFVAVGVVIIVFLLLVLVIKLTIGPDAKTPGQKMRDAQELVPKATLVGVCPGGYEIYEFIDPKSNQRCLLYRHSIVVLPEKKD